MSRFCWEGIALIRETRRKGRKARAPPGEYIKYIISTDIEHVEVAMTFSPLTAGPEYSFFTFFIIRLHISL